ncbi:MAG: endonuclease domain-containing protein [Candidatus Paceibacterota bacterium]
MTNAEHNARHLRQHQTRSEGLLWSVLRAGQLCGLKFRRQHTISPWIVDFACIAKRLIVEIDGGYHDATQEEDLRRQRDLETRGWTVLRFTDEDVERDAEAVARSIIARVGLEYQFKPRQTTGSGKKSIKAKKSKKSPPLADARPSRREG